MTGVPTPVARTARPAASHFDDATSRRLLAVDAQKETP
jgi:hypothetical protein